jgi:drug/metabolite transporter (DMT)-like permease
MIEAWLLVAAFAVLLKTGYDALQKHLTVDYDGLELSYVTSVLGFGCMTPVGAWYLATADVTLTPGLVGALLFSGAANVVAIVAFLTALGEEDLSVVSPLVQSTPVMVAVVEPLVLPVAFDRRVALGALAAVVGAYVLLTDAGDPLAPLRRLTGRPALLALAAAALYAGVNVANRFIATQIPPLFYGFLIYLLMAVGFVAVLSVRLSPRDLPTRALLRPRLGLLGGLTAARTSVTYVAFSLAAAARVSIVLQASTLLSVVAGGVLFAEEGLLRRLLGAACIVAGVVATL